MTGFATRTDWAPEDHAPASTVIAIAEDADADELERLRKLAVSGVTVLLVPRQAAASVRGCGEPAVRTLTVAGRPGSVPRGLSLREHAILTLIADGMTTREVAARLRYSERTIKGNVQRMCLRFDTANRAHLISYAARRGWL